MKYIKHEEKTRLRNLNSNELSEELKVALKEKNYPRASFINQLIISRRDYGL